MKHVILYGGGMDSALTTHLLSRQAYSLFHVNYGQKTYPTEADALMCVGIYYNLPCITFRVPNFPKMPWRGKTAKDFEVAGRNLFLVSCAASYYGNLNKDDYTFWLGGSADSLYYDASGKFIKSLNATLAGYKRFRVRCWQIETDQTAYSEHALAQTVIPPAIKPHISYCYAKNIAGKLCGQCPKCTWRKKIFNRIAKDVKVGYNR